MDVVKQISPRAEQFLSEYGLGKVQGEYTDGFIKRGLNCVALLPIGCIMIALTLPTLLAPDLTNGDWWQRLGSLSFFLLGGSCLSLFGVLGLFLLGVTLWRGEMHLYVGEKGFISVRRQIETIVHWEAITTIHKQIIVFKSKSENMPHTSSCSYTIIPAEGKPCSLSAEPGPAIEATVTAIQLPRALERATSGQTLSFGWLALDGKGLYLTPEQSAPGHPTRLAKLPGVARILQKLVGTSVESGEYFLSWGHLSCYWIDESRSTLILSKDDERKHWAIVPLYRIANPALCLALIERFCGGNQRTMLPSQEEYIR